MKIRSFFDHVCQDNGFLWAISHQNICLNSVCYKTNPNGVKVFPHINGMVERKKETNAVKLMELIF